MGEGEGEGEGEETLMEDVSAGSWWTGAASSDMTTSASGIPEIRTCIREKGAMSSVLAPASSVVISQARPSCVVREIWLRRAHVESGI